MAILIAILIRYLQLRQALLTEVILLSETAMEMDITRVQRHLRSMVPRDTSNSHSGRPFTPLADLRHQRVNRQTHLAAKHFLNFL